MRPIKGPYTTPWKSPKNGAHHRMVGGSPQTPPPGMAFSLPPNRHPQGWRFDPLPRLCLHERFVSFSLVRVWVQFGFSLVLVWFQYGFSLVLVWFQFGCSLVLVWCQFGFSVFLVWFQFGLSVVLVCPSPPLQHIRPFKGSKAREKASNKKTPHEPRCLFRLTEI